MRRERNFVFLRVKKDGDSVIRYLLSKIDFHHHFDEELIGFMERDIKEEKIIFIPTSPDEKAATQKYVEETLRFFEKAQIYFKKSVTLYSDMDPEAMSKEIKGASVLYLMGGNTLRQYDFIVHHNLQSVLKEFKGVVIGISAGAINMCRKAVLTPIHEVEEVHLYNGLDLVSFSVEVHFERSNKIHEQMVLNIAGKIDNELYCISDFSAIRMDDHGHMSIIGGGVYKVSGNEILKLS
ncbi:Type 1 glutamine amidotransferase-like domain-containing protein [Bacillus smithii]|uniref:Type 1 glutamine amidotransferase-like domain-containing protein n=1 Tax=Bacillus smithii TaxID=1479 RepID=UPI002E1D0F6F|nr:Type 1 glutamine amidotransferase-like domain-containing protein [Bacillus smithii]